jgi:DNA ligase (NAD+)
MENEIISNLKKVKFDKLPQELEKYHISQLKSVKDFLDDEYYNTDNSSLSDERYDILKEFLENLQETDNIGAPVRNDVKKVKLPFWMGSLDKIKPESVRELERWVEKYMPPYVVTPKLDGLSCLLEYKNNKISLYTRGDGEYGSDISHLYNIIGGIPKKVLQQPFYVRGELIIKLETFENFKNEFKNARQLVSGIVNSKNVRVDIAKNIDFIAYEIIYPGESETQSDQLDLLYNQKFNIPEYTIFDEINSEVLTEQLMEWKKDYPYYIDGIVVSSNSPYFRNTDGNPDYSFAFKVRLEDSVVEAKVLDVEWKVSKRGFLKPRVKIEPVELSGVEIRYATGFNGKFINDNKIGPGSIIKIVRSGDVIPYIIEVVKQSKEALLPPSGTYEWNSTGVEIVAKGMENEMCISILTNFFKTMGTEYISDKTVKKLYESGYDSLMSILNASISDFEKIDRMGKTSAKKLYDNIHSSLQNVKLSRLLAASGTLGLGMGEKKIRLLLNKLPNIFKNGENIDKIKENILKIKGFSEKTAKVVVENLEVAKIFLKKIKVYVTFEKSLVDNSSKLFEGLKIVFSGFRDSVLQKKIEDMGGEIGSSVSKKTNLLVVKDISDTTGKIGKARELGVKILDINQFLAEYKI